MYCNVETAVEREKAAASVVDWLRLSGQSVTSPQFDALVAVIENLHMHAVQSLFQHVLPVQTSVYSVEGLVKRLSTSW